MRDSQSIFDQLLAFGEAHVSAEDVHRLLGTASDDRLIAISSALVKREQAEALTAFHAALDAGVQLGELTDQLLHYMRDLMVLASGADSIELLSVAPASRDALAQQAEQWGLKTVVAAMQILADAKTRMQRVTYGRALAELALVRIAMLEELVDIQTLIEQLKSDATSDSRPAAAQKKNDSLTPAPPPASQSSPAPPVASSEPEVQPAPAETASVAPAERSAPAPQTTAPVREEMPAHEPSSEKPQRPEPATVISGQVQFSPENADSLWTQVVGEITDMLKSHVKAVSSVAISAPNKLELTFPRSYHFSKRFCEKPEAIGRLEQIVARLTGQEVRISLALSEETAAAASDAESKPDDATGRQKRVYKPEDDDFVSNVMETFSAQVVRVDPIAGAAEPQDDD